MFGALSVSILAKRGLSVGPHESRMGVAERRQKLRSQYFFDCDCPPCEREKQRPSAGPGQGAFRCHHCRALLQVNLSPFSSRGFSGTSVIQLNGLKSLGGCLWLLEVLKAILSVPHTLITPYRTHREGLGFILSPAKSRKSHLN